ncbi:exported protein family 1, putative [Plasmodium sp.]|nr:exported protein family 1, putative [Plasmodium sp.]
MYEYIGNAKVPIFVKLLFEKNISIEDIFYYFDEYELLKDNEIRILLKSSFSNFILESIGRTYENVSNIFLEEKSNSEQNNPFIKQEQYVSSSNYILNNIKNNIDYSMDNIHRAIDNLYYEHILNLLKMVNTNSIQNSGHPNFLFKRDNGLQSLGRMILQKVN